MAEFKLSYFDLRGRAEPIRIALELAGKSYESIIYSKTEWPVIKKKLIEDETLPFGTIPLLEYNGNKYVQSMSIMRYLGNLFGFYGKNAEEKQLIDSIMDETVDLKYALYPVVLSKDENKIKIFGEDNERETTLPHYLYYFDHLKAKNKGDYFIGDKVSIADICVFDVMCCINEFYKGCYEKYEHIKSFMEHFSKLPKYEEYAKSDRRPKEA